MTSEFLTAAPNLPFAVALTVLGFLAVLEVVGLFTGLAVSHAVEKLTAKLGVTMDAHDGLDATDGLTKALHWLGVGRVPMIVVLIVFFAGFGLVGLGLQSVASGVTGVLLPAWIAVWPAAAITLPGVRVTTTVLAKILPRDETTAVTAESLVGLEATIVIGVARAGSPAEARCKDKHGQSHYMLVEPVETNIEFNRGDAVLLVARNGNIFRGTLAARAAASQT